MINLTRTQLALLLVPLLALLTVAGSRIAGVGSNQGPAAAQPLARFASEPGAAGARARLVVHVVGAVRRPGLFRVSDGARFTDALVRAGGATPRADLSAGQPCCTARRRTAGGSASTRPAGRGSRPGRARRGSKVSLGIATIEQLHELPGIGPVTAQKIVDWRASNGPFRSVEDLDDVRIGPARIEQFRQLVTP